MFSRGFCLAKPCARYRVNSEATTAPPPEARPRKILLVDDDLFILKIYGEGLARRGSQGATVADLRRQLATRVPPLSGLLRHMMFAIDAQYVSADALLPPDAEVACIPPVSGG